VSDKTKNKTEKAPETFFGEKEVTKESIGKKKKNRAIEKTE